MDRADGPYRGAGQNLDHYDHRGCSYCGSMDPEKFMQAVRDGVEVGPTDKSYKVYVGGAGQKFYTAHFAPEQAIEFRDLYLAGEVNMGYPGRFYNPLYLPLPTPGQ